MVTKSKKFNNAFNSATMCFCSFIFIISFLTAFVSAILMYEQSCLAYSVTGYDITGMWFPTDYGIDLSLYPEIENLRFQIIVTTIVHFSSDVIALLFLLLCLICVGVKDENGIVQIKKIDKIPAELQLLLSIFAVSGLVISAEFLASAISKTLADMHNLYHRYRFYSDESKMIEFIGGGLLSVIAIIVVFWCVLSIVRKIKARKLIKTSIFGLILLNPLKRIYKSGSFGKKMAILFVGACLLSATVFLAPVIIVVVLVCSAKWCNKYDEVQKGLDEVSRGNFEYKIPITGSTEMDIVAAKINSIAEASNKAIQNELKSQRMKTDLITNVSHDLKTPLTSMITYVDLLKTEGLNCERAEEYLEIIDQKTRRLKQLTEDLFEAAKASSGTMPIDISKVAVVSIINQALGELNEKIEASTLDFIVNTPKEEHYVWADGRQLWRVLENLIGNAIKYAQPNSRVYIDVEEGFLEKDNIRTEAVRIIVKNVSKDPLNIDADTLLERFTRGDSSRSIEGSGLGLAISNDLMKLMKGTFNITIDGDLFKCSLILPAYDGKEEETAEGKETVKTEPTEKEIK